MEKKHITADDLAKRVTISVDEFASLMSISRPMGYVIINSNDGPPYISVGKRKILPTEGVKRWIAEQSTKRAAV